MDISKWTARLRRAVMDMNWQFLQSKAFAAGAPSSHAGDKAIPGDRASVFLARWARMGGLVASLPPVRSLYSRSAHLW